MLIYDLWWVEMCERKIRIEAVLVQVPELERHEVNPSAWADYMVYY